MSDPRDNVQQEFLAEAQELVEALSRDLLLLDEAYHRNENIDPALINEIFRSVHTLKGIAGMFGYKHVGAVAHALEDLLDDLRLGRSFVGQQLLDLLFDSVERFQRLLALDDPKRRQVYPDLPLIENERVIDREVTGEDQAQLTTQYTERAVQFIHRHAEQPFLLYVPHSMVHVPLFVSEKFRGRSGKGLFADVVMEVDWSVGQILAAIREEALDENTLVIFTADNGPWLSYGDHAGSAGPLREGKGTMFEGGTREPTIMRWPGHIAAGTRCDELASTIDILPTVAALIGAVLPPHPIDGKDIRPLMFGEPEARSPHEAFYCYYAGGQLQAIRDRQWKLYFPHSYRTLAGRPGGTGGLPVAYEQATSGLELYDLKADLGESRDVAEQHPDIVDRLQQLAEVARNDLGDTLTNRRGSGIRSAGQLGEGDPRLEW